jgi:aspartyl-tRNA(Asn)/glutamyl-tRNA(Gln) amidotransferase subunit B
MPSESIQSLKEVLIGLEVHCQLTNLKTKLFCGCSTDYRRDPPNTHVCPVCLGIPGSLPTVNRKAIEDAIVVSLALNSQVSRKSYFFRKNYYYPDMSKNFQISQYDQAGGIPISCSGGVEIQVDHAYRMIRIKRLQLEEDPAKLVHLGPIDSSPYTLVDYNRAGVALLEIVTEPDLRSPTEARIFLQKLRSILEHLGVSDGRFEGSMRCDANISLSGGKRVEIKNISSFKEVERALNFEMTRQRSLLSRGSTVSMETRHWDEARRLTISLRSKEAEHDYRYFPEPDLVPIMVSEEWLTELASTLPELPDSRRDRLVKTYHIPAYDATVLTREKALVDFYEECATLYSDAKTISNWVIGDLLRWLHEDELEIEASKITPKTLVAMIKLIDEGVISGKIAKRILPEMIRTGKKPREIVEEKDLLRLGSPKEIEGVVNRVFKENPGAVQDALLEEKAIHYLVGQVMKVTRGRADPELTNKIVKEKLGTLGEQR